MEIKKLFRLTDAGV